jgi:hypothetical protein
MKLIFGDLSTKSRIEQELKDQAKFEKQVTAAFQQMEFFANLPDESASIWDYPRHVRHFPIAALREATRQIRTARER